MNKVKLYFHCLVVKLYLTATISHFAIPVQNTKMKTIKVMKSMPTAYPSFLFLFLTDFLRFTVVSFHVLSHSFIFFFFFSVPGFSQNEILLTLWLGCLWLLQRVTSPEFTYFFVFCHEINSVILSKCTTDCLNMVTNFLSCISCMEIEFLF